MKRERKYVGIIEISKVKIMHREDMESIESNKRTDGDERKVTATKRTHENHGV